ncbi:hypothetical protein [Mycobacterium sp. AZCC_0083]|uniref:hypothetical protein n=1 Tax=Mycobacterium sp. AZCC_0083 TaxID=2735882 RepID=UPI00161AC454|nr:hypothetical protein [Mycobacterium sp. AZCC_0083]MBB5166882.1 hypothetical protein [Mycobacterium sp. AZCC_0083]
MDHTNFHHLGGNFKSLAAIVGIAGIVTMGAISVAGPTSSVGTDSDNWMAESNLTLAPKVREQPSFDPQVIVDKCSMATLHMRMHHNC